MKNKLKQKNSKFIILAFIIIFAGIGTYLLTNSRAATGVVGPSANLWIDQTTDTPHDCIVAASIPGAGDYATAKNNHQLCSDIQTALSKLSAGQTAIVKAGNYGGVSLNVTKTAPPSGIAPVTIYGETTAPGVTFTSLNTSGSNYIIQDMTVDTGTTHNAGWGVGGSNITGNNIKLHGGFVRFMPYQSTNITWHGGELGQAGLTGLKRVCGMDDEPVYNIKNTNLTIDSVNFYAQNYDPVPGPGCNSSNGFHLEMIRIDHGADGFTLKNSSFIDPTNDDTATVFITHDASTGDVMPRNLKFYNNYFGPDNKQAITANDAYTTCTNITIAYNTFVNSFGFLQHSSNTNGCTTVNNVLVVGNLGYLNTAAPCTGTHIKNVWQNMGSIVCGSDRFVNGPNDSVSSLGIGSDGFHLLAGSTAINAGETAYCSSILGNVDHDGGTRPVGAACDAGAIEFGSTGGTPPPPPPPPSPKPGDTEPDGDVDAIDLSNLLSSTHWKSTSYSAGDFNGDGIVNARDLSILLSNYGQ